MSLIAVRRNLQPGAVFFRQVGHRLEYSLDKITWGLAYDFGHLACIDPEAATQHADIVTTWAGYDGTAASIGPDLVFDTTSQDYYRDIALCLAMDSIFSMYERMIHLAAFEWPLNILQAAAQAAAQGFASAQPLLAYNVASAWRVSEAAKMFGLTIAQELSEGPPELSEAALAQIKCCAYNNLKGATPTFTAFYDAFDPASCAFAAPDSPEEKALEALQRAIQRDIQIYLGFLTIAQALYDLLGVDASCECDDRWVHTWDFRQPGFLDDFDSYNLSGATLIPGVGLYKNTRFDATFTKAAPYTMIGLAGEYDTTWGPGASGPILRVWVNGVTPPQYQVYQDNQQGVNLTFQYWQAPMAVVGGFRTEVRHVSQIYTAPFTLKYLHVFGQGVNPFG